ncbi:hypothetical protein QYF36_011477 [Acer negundo]|nr:hypothetical protein QYF36_011477 [Acer negundo]
MSWATLRDLIAISGFDEFRGFGEEERGKDRRNKGTSVNSFANHGHWSFAEVVKESRPIRVEVISRPFEFEPSKGRFWLALFDGGEVMAQERNV